MKNKYAIIAFFTILFTIYALPLLAEEPTFPDETPASAPVDGGLSLLIAAGAGYGMKKLKEKRNRENKK